MKWHREIWTYLIVTIVTVLIWTWAAGETREQKTLGMAQVQFVVPEPGNWVISPARQPVSIGVVGPKQAIQKIERLLHSPIALNVPVLSGRQNIDLLDCLRRQDEVIATGVTILTVEPATAEIDLDPIEHVTAKIKPVLPGITTDGEITVEPAEAKIAVPSSLRALMGTDLFAEAAFERFELDRLEPGKRQTLDTKLRLPGAPQFAEGVLIQPVKAKVSFTIRSRIRDTLVPTVPVLLAGAPDEKENLITQIEPRNLENVTVSADADLVRRIETGEVSVVAMLYLTVGERKDRIESKKIGCFLAMVPQPGGGIQGEVVTARWDDSPEAPTIKLKITEKASPKSSKPPAKGG